MSVLKIGFILQIYNSFLRKPKKYVTVEAKMLKMDNYTI